MAAVFVTLCPGYYANHHTRFKHAGRSGGSRQRQERRQDRQTAEQNTAASSSAYTNCLQQHGYQVTP